MFSKIGKFLYIPLVSLILFGCQHNTMDTMTHIQDNKYDFATGVNAVVDYVSDGERTFVILNITNPKRTGLDIWLDQTYLSMGAETSRKKRLLTSSKSKIEKTIKAPVLEKGVKELIVFEIFDREGNTLFKTEPIENDYGYDNNDDSLPPLVEMVRFDTITISGKSQDVIKPEPVVEPVIDGDNDDNIVADVDLIEGDYVDAVDFVVKTTPVVEEPPVVVEEAPKETAVVVAKVEKPVEPKVDSPIGDMFTPFIELEEIPIPDELDVGVEQPVKKGILIKKQRKSGGPLEIRYSSNSPW